MTRQSRIQLTDTTDMACRNKKKSLYSINFALG